MTVYTPGAEYVPASLKPGDVFTHSPFTVPASSIISIVIAVDVERDNVLVVFVDFGGVFASTFIKPNVERTVL